MWSSFPSTETDLPALEDRKRRLTESLLRFGGPPRAGTGHRAGACATVGPGSPAQSKGRTMFAALRSRRAVAVGLVALAVSAGVATLAYASIPDGNGVIHGCYSVNGQGQVDGSASLRVIDPASTNPNGQACKNNERALDWSQTGPTGRQGPTGATGPTGPQGPEGSGHAFVATTPGHVTIH